MVQALENSLRGLDDLIRQGKIVYISISDTPAWSVFGALSLRLSHAQLARLDEAGAIEPDFPHDFLGSDGIDEVVYGGTRDRIQNHRGWI